MGARVVLAARRADALEEVARTIRAGGGEALVVPTDVSRPEAVSALAEAAERRFGHVDIWFNNAAIAAIGRFEEIPVPTTHGSWTSISTASSTAATPHSAASVRRATARS
jgi:NAD(P)-dependent dehydrogenase (short-subunit alcohol dehydrogenase family)